MGVARVKVQALTKGTATQETAERTIDKEFEAGFIHGYVDLKRRVAFDHPNSRATEEPSPTTGWTRRFRRLQLALC